MTAIDLHPEELLDRARRGQASPEELRRLREHVASCAACAFERAFARDCDDETEPDADRLQRLARSSVSTLLARSRGEQRSPRARPRLLAALAIAALATAAGASLLVERSYREPPLEPAAPPPEPVPPARAALPVPVAPSATPATADVSPSAAPPAALREKTAPGANPPDVTAAGLFARANAERRRGDLGRAVDGYRELQRRFPASPEALVSKVTLGRLLLDRLGSPAGALAQFDAYLAGSSHGALREEALIGRALALGRLGRRAEERGAWHALLTGYPSSAYAGRARDRLERLRSP